MSQSTLNQILAQVPALETAELRYLQGVLQEHLSAPPPGVPDTAPTPPTSHTEAPNPPRLVEATGPPVSETIRAERR